MRVERLSGVHVQRLGGPAAAAAMLRSLTAGTSAVEAAVREISEQVRERGDEAVLAYTRALDTAGTEPRPLEVAPEELDEALRQLPLELVAGLQITIANVAELAQAAVGEQVSVALPQGQQIVLRELPVASAAVYVPGGRAPYPSTVAMGVVTARAAGVLDVAVASPPGSDGEIDATILGACRLCGVEHVYRMGGAQAIAALAYGTDTVPRVDVIVGPGNLYVQEAKKQLSALVGIDGFAGPSDLLVALGSDASETDVALAALDMLAQREHGPGTIVIGCSPEAATLDALAHELERLVAGSSNDADAGTDDSGVDAGTDGNGADAGTGGNNTDAVTVLVEVADARAAIELVNAFAPEHVQLIGADVEALAAQVRSAGCLFVGPASATAFGDYVAGSNHVLPTGGAARFASTLSPRHFRRRMADVRIDQRAAAKLAKAGVPIARAEGFEWHARSMEARMGDNA